MEEEIKYLGYVINDATSDGNGLVILTCEEEGIPAVVQKVIAERVKNDINADLVYAQKDKSKFDFSCLDEFVKRHTRNVKQKFYFEAEEEDFREELQFNPELEAGHGYTVEVHDMRKADGLKGVLQALEKNTFVYFHELSWDAQEELAEAGIVF